MSGGVIKSLTRNNVWEQLYKTLITVHCSNKTADVKLKPTMYKNYLISLTHPSL